LLSLQWRHLQWRGVHVLVSQRRHRRHLPEQLRTGTDATTDHTGTVADTVADLAGAYHKRSPNNTAANTAANAGANAAANAADDTAANAANANHNADGSWLDDGILRRDQRCSYDPRCCTICHSADVDIAG